MGLAGGSSTGTVICLPRSTWSTARAASGCSRTWSPELWPRVYSFPDNRACIAELLAREQAARAEGLGVWASSAYRIENALDVNSLGRLIHSYQLVEGRVVVVGEGAGCLYLNFATDWRSDFTVSVARKDVSAFAAAEIDLNALTGKRVRARGAFLLGATGP